MSGITLDAVILSAATSNIAISDGVDTLAIDGSGNITVNAAGGSFAVTATDLDIRDLTHVSDSVKVGDGTNFLAVAADGSIAVTDNGASLTVDAVNLDIRDLSASQDNVAISDGTDVLDILVEDAASAGGEKGILLLGVRQDAGTSPVSADGDFHYMTFNSSGELKTSANLSSSVADDAADAGNPIKIGGRAFDGALSAISASNDRFDLLGDMYRRVWINDSANIGINTEAVSVTTTAAEVLVTPLAGRRFVTIQNRNDKDIFLVESGATAKAQGIYIPKNSSATFNFGEDINIFLVADSGTADVRLLEAG